MSPNVWRYSIYGLIDTVLISRTVKKSFIKFSRWTLYPDIAVWIEKESGSLRNVDEIPTLPNTLLRY
jgi:hypothetical protein